MKKRTKAKTEPKYNETDLAPDRGVSKEKSIPQFDLECFVGYVPNLYKIDAVHLWDDRFRVNVWCAREVEGHLYEKYNIEKSFHVEYKDGEFVDKSNPVRNFDVKYL